MSESQKKYDDEREFWDDKITQSRIDYKDEDLRVGADDYHDRFLPHTPYLGLDQVNQKGLDLLGDVRGKKVLDCGCGNGLMTTLLAQRGAQITATDISPESLALTMYRAKLNNVADQVKPLLMNAEELDFEEESFDFVIGSLVLHHTDLEKSGRAIRRVLRPGGKGIFIETSGYNPALIFARTVMTGRMGIPKFGTTTEFPLGPKEVSTLRKIFKGRCFLHQPNFLCFRMAAGYIQPLSGPRSAAVLHWIDKTLGQLSGFFRRYSYFMVVELKK